MGHHIDENGEFRSDLWNGTQPGKPDIGTDKIVLSFKDPLARRALWALALDYRYAGGGLGDDIQERLQSIESVSDAPSDETR